MRGRNASPCATSENCGDLVLELCSSSSGAHGKTGKHVVQNSRVRGLTYWPLARDVDSDLPVGRVTIVEDDLTLFPPESDEIYLTLPKGSGPDASIFFFFEGLQVLL